MDRAEPQPGRHSLFSRQEAQASPGGARQGGGCIQTGHGSSLGLPPSRFDMADYLAGPPKNHGPEAQFNPDGPEGKPPIAPGRMR